MVPIVHHAQVPEKVNEVDRYRDGAVVTVGDILRQALPDGTEVLAGEALLGRQVASIVALRSRPASLGDLRGDELVLLSTDALAALDPSPSLVRVIDSLKETAAAMAVRGAVSREAIEAAEQDRIPLLLLPPGPPLSALAREVQAFLAEQRTTWYQLRHQVLQDLTALALAGSGLEAIADRMSQTSGCAVAFADAQGTVLAMAFPPGFPLGREPLIERIRSAGPRGPTVAPNDLVGWLSAPVVVRNQPAGTAYMVAERARLSSETRLVLETGATAAAIELAREEAVRETVDRIQGDLISDLVTGSGNRDELARRASRLGYNLDAARVAIAIRLEAERGQGGPEAAHRRLLRMPPSPLLGSVSYSQVPAHLEHRRLILFLEGDAESARPAVARIAEEIVRAVQTPGTRLAAGISRPHAGPESFRLAHDDAVQALELGRTVAPDRRAVHFDDLGIYRLLLSTSEVELTAFRDEILGPLVTYDRDKGSALVATLDAYLRSRNASEAAQHLSLHRNSLLYRLRRIREITGADLDDPETRLSLHLALRASEAARVRHRADETWGSTSVRGT